jgi:hypothetical protein
MNLRGFCRLWGRAGARRVVVALIAAATAFVVVSGTERALRGSSEFMGFRRMVQVDLVLDRNRYEVIAHPRAYAPCFSILWAPFGAFPTGLVPDKDHPLQGTTRAEQLQLGASAFFVLALMAALTFWSARLVAGACRLQEAGAGRCAPALLWVFAGGLMLNSVARVETDMFVVILVAGAMYLMFARDEHWLAGGLLGAAAAFKLTPGLFGVYLLCRRNWRGAAGMVVGGLVCGILLPLAVWGPAGAYERHDSWLADRMLPLARQGPEAFISHAYRRTNQSLKAALVRSLTPYNAGKSTRPQYVNVASMPRPAADRVATVLKLALLAVLMAAWLLTPREREARVGPALFALVPLGMLLISDVSVGGHMAVLLVPFGALTGFCFRHAGRRVGTAVSWGVLLGFALASLIAVKWLKELSVGTAGILILLVLTLYVALREE